MEEEFSKEKYRHTIANHTTFLQGVCRLPFNIFECSDFVDYVKASGLDFAAKVPTQKEIQEGLSGLNDPLLLHLWSQAIPSP